MHSDLLSVIEEFRKEYPSLSYEHQPKQVLHVFKTWYYTKTVVNVRKEKEEK